MNIVNKFLEKTMNNKKKLILFFILLTIISVLPIFMLETPYGGDLNFHLKRIEAIKINFQNGEFNYPIYFNYLNGYGYASGIFYPDLFLNIPSFLNYIGINIFVSYKIFLFIVKFLSLLSIYYSVKAINKSKKSGLIAVILYAFSSYCFIDMFERGALAETITIIFIPIVIRGIYEIIHNDSKKYYILTFGMLGLLYSHIISLYLMTIFLLIYVIINIKKINKNKLKDLLKATLLFILIGSHFMFPLLEQMINNNFYYNEISNTDILIDNAVPIYLTFLEIPYYIFMNIFTSKWIPSGIGIIYLIFIIYYFKNKDKFDKISKQFMFLGIFCILFASKTFLWNLEIFKQIFSYIQFPFRIYILATNLFIISFSRIFKNIEIKKLTIFMFIMFIFNLFYPFINVKVNKLTNDEILYGEYLPIEYPNLNYSNNRKDKIISNCNIKYEIKRNIKTNILYSSNCDALLLEIPIIYYKGYQVKINDKIIDINKSENGLIEISTNIKKGNIEILYNGTTVYKVTKYISLITIIIVFIKEIRGFFYDKKTKNNIYSNTNNRNTYKNI